MQHLSVDIGNRWDRLPRGAAALAVKIYIKEVAYTMKILYLRPGTGTHFLMDLEVRITCISWSHSSTDRIGVS